MLQSHAVGLDHQRCLRRINLEADSFFLRHHGKQVAHGLDDFLGGHIYDFEFHFTGFNFRQIEDFVNQAKQSGSRTLDDFREFDLLVR